MAFSYPPRYGLRLLQPPSVEPVQLGEAMEHLNIGFDDRQHDAWINRNIKTAREWCEGWLGRALAPQTLELSFGGQSMPIVVPSTWNPAMLTPWTDDDAVIQLPMGPVASIAYVRYLDADGATQPFTDYTLDTWSDTPGAYLSFGSSWPATQASRNAIQIRYIAGYTLADDSPSAYPLPWSLHSAMLLVLGDLFKNRENSTDMKLENIPLGAQSLMVQYQLRLGFA